MERISTIEKVKQGILRFNKSTWKKIGGATMLALAAVSQTSSVANAEVPNMRVVEVCASPGHNFVEVDVFNDRSTPLTVTQTTRNKMGVLIPTDPLTIAPHGSNGENFNVGIIEGGSITYTESGVPSNTYTEDNICAPKPTTTTSSSSTTSTTRMTTTSTTNRPDTTTSSTVKSSASTTTTLADGPLVSVPEAVVSADVVTTATIPQSQPAQPQQVTVLSLTG